MAALHLEVVVGLEDLVFDLEAVDLEGLVFGLEVVVAGLEGLVFDLEVVGITAEVSSHSFDYIFHKFHLYTRS